MWHYVYKVTQPKPSFCHKTSNLDLTFRGQFVQQDLLAFDLLTLAGCDGREVHLNVSLGVQILLLQTPVGGVKPCPKAHNLALTAGGLKQGNSIPAKLPVQGFLSTTKLQYTIQTKSA